jgi:hypothetical protein
MAGMGQEDPFPPLKLSDRCRSGKQTLAGVTCNGRDAPIADFRGFDLTAGFDRPLVGF